MTLKIGTCRNIYLGTSDELATLLLWRNGCRMKYKPIPTKLPNDHLNSIKDQKIDPVHISDSCKDKAQQESEYLSRNQSYTCDFAFVRNWLQNGKQVMPNRLPNNDLNSLKIGKIDPVQISDSLSMDLIYKFNFRCEVTHRRASCSRHCVSLKMQSFSMTVGNLLFTR